MKIEPYIKERMEALFSVPRPPAIERHTDEPMQHWLKRRLKGGDLLAIELAHDTLKACLLALKHGWLRKLRMTEQLDASPAPQEDTSVHIGRLVNAEMKATITLLVNNKTIEREAPLNFAVIVMRNVLMAMETGMVEQLMFAKPYKARLIIDTADPGQRVWDSVVDELEEALRRLPNI